MVTLTAKGRTVVFRLALGSVLLILLGVSFIVYGGGSQDRELTQMITGTWNMSPPAQAGMLSKMRIPVEFRPDGKVTLMGREHGTWRVSSGYLIVGDKSNKIMECTKTTLRYGKSTLTR